MEFENKNYPDIIKEWVLILKGKNKKDTTIKNYVGQTVEFLKYMKWQKLKTNKDDPKDVDIFDISKQLINRITVLDVEKYTAYLAETKKNTGSSINRKLAALETFYNFLCKSKIVKENILLQVDRAEEDEKVKKPLNLEQARMLLKGIKNSNKQFEIRDYCMFTLFIDVGFRKEELSDLKMEQIKTRSLIFEGKGAKEREVILSDNSIPILKNYLEFREEYLKTHNLTSDYVFINKFGDKLTNIYRILKEYTEAIGIENCSPHTLRRTAATLRYKYGKIDIRRLQKMLGHSSVNTTQRYVNIDEDQLLETANSLPSLE